MKDRWKIVSMCVVLVAAAGLVSAAQPDFSGTWRANSPKGQTTLIINHSGDSMQVTVEGRNFLGFDDMTFVTDGANHDNVTATWQGNSLVTRINSASQRAASGLTAYRQFSWNMVGSDLQVTVAGAKGEMERMPTTVTFTLQ
jgi:hypothetical protein